MVFLKAQSLAQYYFFFILMTFSNFSEILDFNLFVDDANLFYKHKNLRMMNLM